MNLKEFLKENEISKEQFYHWRELGLIPDDAVKFVALKNGGRKLELTEKTERRVRIIKLSQKIFGRKKGIKRASG